MTDKLVSEGQFRVDRQRALDKIERFQLEDPHRYVLELVAAAVVGGAEKIDVINDSDDFVLQWRGPAPSRAELDTVFDWVFSRPSNAHEELLRHLATGVLGALGLGPRWLHVDAVRDDGAWRLEVVDAATATSIPGDPNGLPGVRVHVRERLTAAVLREALAWAVQAPRETSILAGALLHCPIPVLVNGAPLARAEPPEAPIATFDGNDKTRSWSLAVVPYAGNCAVVRHGVVVATHSARIANAFGEVAFSIVGAVHDDQLRLNASRSMVVQDARYKALSSLVMRRSLIELRDQWPALRADGEAMHAWHTASDGRRRSQVATRAELLTALAPALVAALLNHKLDLGALADVPIFTDVVGRVFSVDGLRALATPPGSAVAPDPSLVAALEHPAVFDAASHAYHRLLMQVRDDVVDVTQALAELDEGRVRRLAAPRRAMDLGVGGPQHRFAAGGVSGTLRWVTDSPARVELQLHADGRPVEWHRLDAPAGQWLCWVNHADLVPDARFRTVARDAVFDEVIAAVQAAVKRQLLERVCDPHLPPATRLPQALSLLGGRSLDEALAPNAALDEALLTVPVFSRLSGRVASLRQLAEPPDGGWYITADHVANCPPSLADRALLVPSQLLSPVSRLLGARVSKGYPLAVEARRQQRLNQPKRDASLGRGYYRARLLIDDDRLRGELALSTNAVPSLMVLIDGLPVGTLTLPDEHPPGLVGVVDMPDGKMNDALDALTPASQKILLGRVAPHVDQIVRDAWIAHGSVSTATPLPPAVLGWLALVGQQKRDLPAWADPLPVAAQFDGEVLTVAALRARAKVRRGKHLVTLDTTVSGGDLMPQAVPVTPPLRQVLEQLTEGRLRDGLADLEQVRYAMRQWDQRALVPPPPAALIALSEDHDGFTLDARIPLYRGDAAAPAPGKLSLEAVYRGRRLDLRLSQMTLGPWARAAGPKLLPNRQYNGPVDAAVVRAARDAAERAFPKLLDAALAALPESRAVPSTAVATWRALAIAMHEEGVRMRSLSRYRNQLRSLPLLVDLSGTWWTADAIYAAHSNKRLVFTVNASLGGGPTDDVIYLVDEPLVAALCLAVLGAPVQDGSQRLVAWREGELRRRGAVRRQVGLPATAQWVATAVDGERQLVIGLDPTLGTERLEIEPIVDGIALAVIRQPCAWPVRVSVACPALTAEVDLRGLVRDAAWRSCLAWITQSVDRWAAAQVAERYATEPDARALGRRWVLANEGAVSLHALPLVPVLGGSFARVTALIAAANDGGAPVVAQASAAWPAGPPPFVLSAQERRLLGERWPLCDLGWVLEASNAPTRPADALASVGLLDAPSPQSLWVVAGRTSNVVLRVHGVVVGPVAVRGPLALVGVVDVALEPDAHWRTFEPATGEVAVRERVSRASFAAVDTLLGEQPARAMVQAALREALWSWLATAGALDDLVHDRVSGPMARLAGAPLLVDSQGQSGSFNDMLADAPVRCVAPGVRGMPAVGASRVWCLSTEQVVLLRDTVTIVDATATLRAEDEGQRRRMGPPWTRTEPPRARWGRPAVVQLAGVRDGFEFRLWLLEPSQTTVAIIVDDRLVEERDLGVPGLQGWVAGPFSTDLAFRNAHIDERAWKVLAGRIAALLRMDAEGAGGSDRLAQRVQSAARSAGSLATLLERRPEVWSDLPALSTWSGRHVSLGALWEQRAGGVTLVPNGADASVSGVVARDHEENRAFLAAVTPRLRVVQWEDPAERLAKRAAEQEELAARRARNRLATTLRAHAVDLLAGLTRPAGWERSLDQAVADLPGWAADGDEGMAWIVAWRIVVSATPPNDLDQHAALAGRLADRLAKLRA